MNQFLYAFIRVLKKLIAANALCLMTFSTPVFASWEKFPSPPTTETIVGLALCSNGESCFFAATANQIFMRENDSWKIITTDFSTNDEIVRIYSFPNQSELWIQKKQSISKWDRFTKKSTVVYQSRDKDKWPLTFLATEKELWIGTATGIWISQDFGSSWQKRSDLADHRISGLIVESSLGVFFSENGYWRILEDNAPQTVLKIFDFSETEESETVFDPEIDTETPSHEAAVFHDFIETEEAFYLATTKGVFQSYNGFDWEAISNSGLRDPLFYRLAWDKQSKQICGFTRHGFFVLDSSKKYWRSQSEGLARLDLKTLLFSPPSSRFVTNTEGLWQWLTEKIIRVVSEEKAALFNKLIRLEPSSREIQKRVIHYSGTGNGKIKRWHAESRLAALAPNFSIGKDWGASNNIDLDRGGTGDPDRFIHGPWDKDRGADLDLSWDLGDFIFSSSQTSIDSRAKLMVDQRNDLLSETTRLYFERRRLQAELLYSPAPDEKTHFDQLSRIDELTALLDGFTDGYFSQRLERIYREYPEMEEIWQRQTQGH